MMIFAAAIKMHRERLGLTQSEAAALFPALLPEDEPLKLRTWQHWEANDRVPPAWAQRLIVAELRRAGAGAGRKSSTARKARK
jgi:hypothetical protein